MADTPKIDKLHITAIAANGDELAIVTFTTGRCGLARNGLPIPGMEWEMSQIDQCTAELIRQARLET
jgi:hypothetical protein